MQASCDRSQRNVKKGCLVLTQHTQLGAPKPQAFGPAQVSNPHAVQVMAQQARPGKHKLAAAHVVTVKPETGRAKS